MNKIKQRTIEVAHHDYQPSKAELNEPIVFPEGTTPEALARAVVQPVEMKFVKASKRGRR